MLLFNKDKAIPESVVAAMEYAETDGATAIGIGITSSDNEYDDAFYEMVLVSKLHPLHPAMDPVIYCIPFAIIKNPSRRAQVALTFAGFRKIGRSVWQWSSDSA